MSKTRLDQWLVAQGLCPSRTLAQRFIQAGQVFVNGQRVDKPAAPVPEGAQVQVKELPRYVSRGGEKLEAALQQFSILPQDKICLDVGASTGGFSDCLLQHGATKVYCVDVGKGQLHPRLRGDPRVVVLEEVNARNLTPEHIPEPIDWITVDVSFISLEKVLPALVPLLKADGELVALVKPQFEAGPQAVGRGGVVKDARTHVCVIERVIVCARALDFFAANVTFSPLRGPAGNIEFLLHLRRSQTALEPDAAAVVAQAHEHFKQGGSNT